MEACTLRWFVERLVSRASRMGYVTITRPLIKREHREREREGEIASREILRPDDFRWKWKQSYEPGKRNLKLLRQREPHGSILSPRRGGHATPSRVPRPCTTVRVKTRARFLGFTVEIDTSRDSAETPGEPAEIQRAKRRWTMIDHARWETLLDRWKFFGDTSRWDSARVALHNRVFVVLTTCVTL